MTKAEILAMTDVDLRIKAGVLAGWHLHVVREYEGRPHSRGWNRSAEDRDPETFVDLPDYPNDIGAAMTDLFESVYGRGGKIKGGAWVLSTVDGGRDVASATLLWKAQSGQKHRANKVTVVCPRGEMAKAITLAWVCAMLGVSDV